MSQLRSFVRAMGIVSSLVLAACGDGEDEKSPEPREPDGLEIVGTWESSFGGTEVIADESWDAFGDDWETSSEIVRYDNESNVLITKGPDFEDPEVDVFGRVLWTEPEDGSFYYCTIAFGLETLADALVDTTTADPSDPEAAGSCGAGSWTKLTEQ